MKEIVVLDYGVGNIKSICNAIYSVGCQPVLSNNKDVIMNASGLVIPGVGAFKHAMLKLSDLDLISCIQDFSLSDKPILGICLGMQILFTESYEFGYSKGLNLIDGVVDVLDINNSRKLPHISWNKLIVNNESWNNTILENVPDKNFMYFVHSFAATPTNQKYMLSSTNYGGVNFCSTVKKGNIYGCQFHPEKSAKMGLEIINKFTDKCKE